MDGIKIATSNRRRRFEIDLGCNEPFYSRPPKLSKCSVAPPPCPPPIRMVDPMRNAKPGNPMNPHLPQSFSRNSNYVGMNAIDAGHLSGSITPSTTSGTGEVAGTRSTSVLQAQGNEHPIIVISSKRIKVNITPIHDLCENVCFLPSASSDESSTITFRPNSNNFSKNAAAAAGTSFPPHNAKVISLEAKPHKHQCIIPCNS